MTVDDLVYWSVAEVNRRNRLLGNPGKPMKMKCPQCGIDNWKVHHGVDSQYASQWNPGEYVNFICTGCGYTDQQPC